MTLLTNFQGFIQNTVGYVHLRHLLQGTHITIGKEEFYDIPRIARKTVIDIGYDRAKYGFDGNTCGVLISIDEQSSDIAMGVDKALEAKEGRAQKGRMNEKSI